MRTSQIHTRQSWNGAMTVWRNPTAKARIVRAARLATAHSSRLVNRRPLMAHVGKPVLGPPEVGKPYVVQKGFAPRDDSSPSEAPEREGHPRATASGTRDGRALCRAP